MEKQTIKRLATVKKIPELYPGVFTESSIRWLIFNEKQNGFSCCVRRLGKKVLIDLDKFESFIDGKQQGGTKNV
ncbi:MAG: DNA-binding protein [Gammaproteobacteria bacterium]